MSDLLAKVQLQITYFVVFELNFENYYLWHALLPENAMAPNGDLVRNRTVEIIFHCDD